MKPAVARELANAHTSEELAAAAEALSEEQTPPFAIGGADAGEQLTHVLLAMRIRARIDAGDDPKDAYRAVMGEVCSVLTNES